VDVAITQYLQQICKQLATGNVCDSSGRLNKDETRCEKQANNFYNITLLSQQKLLPIYQIKYMLHSIISSKN
jgi:hypothetical protein